MKNKLFTVLGIFLVVGFVLLGCDTATSGNSNGNGRGDLEGQWKIRYSYFDVEEDWVLVFRGDVFAFYKVGEPVWKGTFTPEGEADEWDYYEYRIIKTHTWENNSWTQIPPPIPPDEWGWVGIGIRFDDATHISIINVWTGKLVDDAVKGDWVTER
jgi:hypothetical protein